MSIYDHQRYRIQNALRALLRTVTGINPSRSELDSRVQSYLQPDTSGIPGTSLQSAEPLFRALDYAPVSENDPLGGSDGRDISRAFAGVREDLDALESVLGESSRRITQSQNQVAAQNASLSQRINALSLAAKSLQAQAQNLFSGTAPAADGRGSLVFSLTPQSGLVYPQTTAMLLEGGTIALIAQKGAASLGASSGSSIAPLFLYASSAAGFFTEDSFITQPFGTYPSWTAPSGYVTVTIGGDQAVDAFQIGLVNGNLASVSVNGTKQTVSQAQGAANLWIVFPQSLSPGTNVTLFFTSASQYTLSLLQAHTFAFDPESALIWGPLTTRSGQGSLAAACASLTQDGCACPRSSSVSYAVSPASADGPWTALDAKNPVIFSESSQDEVKFTADQAGVDGLSAGFYVFPFSNTPSITGGEFYAGENQFLAESYPFNWAAAGESAHQIEKRDWSNPPALARSVVMGPGPVFQGDLGARQSFSASEYFAQGTCLSRYRDDLGSDLLYLNLRAGDNGDTLQPGYNYRFTLSVYSDGAQRIQDVPCGDQRAGALTGAATGQEAQGSGGWALAFAWFMAPSAGRAPGL